MLEMLELSGARSETSAHLCGVDKKRGGDEGFVCIQYLSSH